MAESNIMELIYWTSGSLGALIGVVFFMTIRKVDKNDFDKHCEAQAKVNDKFNDTIRQNNDLLIEVRTKLHERTK